MVKQHELMQDKIAEDMIEMAVSIRLHSEAANKIIKDDNKVCGSDIML